MNAKFLSYYDILPDYTRLVKVNFHRPPSQHCTISRTNRFAIHEKRGQNKIRQLAQDIQALSRSIVDCFGPFVIFQVPLDPR